ncbi:MAG TPA: hypothetical protein VK914_10140 [bacterium]|jgi:hypothetical protein|nr:hypothetical protein [bacterium]
MTETRENKQSIESASITLLCQAREGAIARLPREAGQGATVLCAPQPLAVATAQRLFPDRRIEVKTLYAEPDLGTATGFTDLRLVRWMLLPSSGGESAEEARRRVVDTSVRLIEIAKSHQDPVLVAGPALLRLVAFKLNAIGFMGGFLLGFKPGERRVFRYQV